MAIYKATVRTMCRREVQIGSSEILVDVSWHLFGPLSVIIY